MAKKRENWASKIGVVLAVAGSAVGLGNFLRFPGVAAANGGGAFLIPYFIAFIFLGIPLAWIEWTLGRYGGQFEHGSAPGILNAVVRKPWAKYLGSLGIFGPLFINFYYIFVESWLLGYVWYAISGTLANASGAFPTMGEFFSQYITLQIQIMGIPAALFFFIITLILNFAIVFFGVKRGIERASRIMMPILVVLGLIMLVRVLTLPNISQGLGFLWNPDFSKLLDINVWFAASGQIFFTLSVGIGAILTYSSYVKKNQDIALSSLSANAANEFLEVIIGGTIVIPAAIVMMGAGQAESIANAGTFNLGFITMPMIFGMLPFAMFFQIVWFLLLFIGGVTSSISLLQPGISFCEDELNMNRRQSIGVLFFVFLIMGLFSVYGLGAGVVDEMDFWAGNFSLILFGTIMAVIFSWVLGVDKGWKEMNRGGDIKIPVIFKFIMKYITPTYLIVLLILWVALSGWNTITMKGIESSPFKPLDSPNITAIIGDIKNPQTQNAHTIRNNVSSETLLLIDNYSDTVKTSHNQQILKLNELYTIRGEEFITEDYTARFMEIINIENVPAEQLENLEALKNRQFRKVFGETYRYKTTYERTISAVLADLSALITKEDFYLDNAFDKAGFSGDTLRLIERYKDDNLDKADIHKLNRFIIADTFGENLSSMPQAEFLGFTVNQKRFISFMRIGFLILLLIINIIIGLFWKKNKLDLKLQKEDA
jgi:SNF family Na+-dependent transporter